jgi:hypothetical protein
MSRLFIIIGVKAVQCSMAGDAVPTPGASGRNNARSGTRVRSLKRKQMNGVQGAGTAIFADGVYASRSGDKI